MLILRFQRQGKKKDFTFRIVAVDSRFAANSGKAKEILGWFNPKTDKFELKKDRILYWLNQGAQASDSCYNLLVKAKVIEGNKRPIKIKKKKTKKGEVERGEVEESKQPSPAEDKLMEQESDGKLVKELEKEQKEEFVADEKVEGNKENADEEIPKEEKSEK